MPEKKKEIKVTARQLIDTYRADQARMQFLQGRQQSLVQIISEMGTAAEAIREIQKAKEDELAMVSLGAGIFVEAKIANVKKIKTSLAGNILVDSTPEKARAELEEAIGKAKKELEGLQMEMQKTGQNMQGIAGILQESQRAAAQQNYPEESNVSGVS